MIFYLLVFLCVQTIVCMEEVQSVADVREKFFIVFIHNKSKSPLTMVLRDSGMPYPNYLNENIMSDEASLQRVYMKYCSGNYLLENILVGPLVNIAVLLDLEKVKVSFPLQLCMTACTRIGDGSKIPDGYNEQNPRVQCKIEKDFNRKTVELDYNRADISIDGKYL